MVSESIREAQARVGAAAIQLLPADDQIIAEHIRCRRRVVKAGWTARLA